MTRSKIQPLPPLKNDEQTPLPPVGAPTHRKFKQRLTYKQKKLVIAYAKTGVKSTAAKMAGLSSVHAAKLINHNPRIQAELDPFINQLANHRQAVLNSLTRREAILDGEDYKTLLTALDVTTKNHQLLSGKATENVAVADVSEQYKQLIEEVKNEN